MQDLVFQFEHCLRLAQLVFLLFLLGHVRQRGEEDGAVLLAAQEEGAHAHPHDLAVQSVPTKGGFGSRDGALVRFGEHALYEGQIVGVHLARDPVLSFAQIDRVASGDVVVLVVHLQQLETVGVHGVHG